MDARAKAASRALMAFDPLAALRSVALRNDPPGVALRGIAMAQLGEFTEARKLLQRAARAFGDEHPAARARCLAAEAEVALASRDLTFAGHGLAAAARVLEEHGDRENALYARLQLVRRLVLLGDLASAGRALGALMLRGVGPRLVAFVELVRADLAVRNVRPNEARVALGRALEAARRTAIPALVAEVARATRSLDAPVARLRVDGTERAVSLDEAAALATPRTLVVDACRREVRAGNVIVPLRARPVLLALAVALAERVPGAATREELAREVFAARAVSDSLRARLRVQIGRLRRMLSGLAEVLSTEHGFSMRPRHARQAVVLLPPMPGEASALVALLGGGEPWSTSALSIATGKSRRAVQRALRELSEEGRAQAVGRGRARRWVAPPAGGFAPTLLLVARTHSE